MSTYPKSLLERLRDGEPVTGETVNQLQARAEDALDEARRLIIKLGEVAYAHTEEPQPEDRETAWTLFKMLDAGEAGRWAAEMYLAVDTDQQYAKGHVAEALGELGGRWERRLDLPESARSPFQADHVIVRCAEDGEWHVLRGSKPSATTRFSRSYVLRSALEHATGFSDREWPERAEREVVDEINERAEMGRDDILEMRWREETGSRGPQGPPIGWQPRRRREEP